MSVYSPFRSPLYRAFGNKYSMVLPTDGLIAFTQSTTISVSGSSYISSSYPSTNHEPQQVYGSGFVGTGSASVEGLLTTDTITASGVAATCAVNGTLTINGTCWDIYVHRDGVLWAYFPGINVGGVLETDSSGNQHTLTDLTGATISYLLDGTGTNYVNEAGYSVSNGEYMYADDAAAVFLPENTIFLIGYIPPMEVVTTDAGLTLTDDNLEELYGMVI